MWTSTGHGRGAGKLGVPLVFGHMGYLSRDVADWRHPSMKSMLRLVKSGSDGSRFTAPIESQSHRVSKGAEMLRWLAGDAGSTRVGK